MEQIDRGLEHALDRLSYRDGYNGEPAGGILHVQIPYSCDHHTVPFAHRQGVAKDGDLLLWNTVAARIGVERRAVIAILIGLE